MAIIVESVKFWGGVQRVFEGLGEISPLRGTADSLRGWAREHEIAALIFRDIKMRGEVILRLQGQ